MGRPLGERGGPPGGGGIGLPLALIGGRGRAGTGPAPGWLAGPSGRAAGGRVPAPRTSDPPGAVASAAGAAARTAELGGPCVGRGTGASALTGPDCPGDGAAVAAAGAAGACWAGRAGGSAAVAGAAAGRGAAAGAGAAAAGAAGTCWAGRAGGSAAVAGAAAGRGAAAGAAGAGAAGAAAAAGAAGTCWAGRAGGSAAVAGAAAGRGAAGAGAGRGAASAATSDAGRLVTRRLPAGRRVVDGPPAAGPASVEIAEEAGDGSSPSAALSSPVACFAAAFFVVPVALRAGLDAGSSGCTGRRSPSRSALRRARSACASSIEDEWLFTPIPRDRQRSSASLFVRPSSCASS